MRRTLFLGAFTVAMLATGPAQSAATFRFVDLQTQVITSAGGPQSAGFDSATTFDFNALQLQSSISRSSEAPGVSASASADLSTDFTSSDQGAFIFESIYAQYDGAGVMGGANSLGVASYGFSVDRLTIATIDYSLFFDGNVTPSTIAIRQDNVSILRINPISSGQAVSIAFGPGDYDLFVSIAASAGSLGIDPVATRSGRIAFTFAEAAVPEPATWAMMIGGIGMAGSALRRTRRKTALLCTDRLA